MLESKRLDHPLVPLLVVLSLTIELLLQATHPRQVLLFLEKDAVSLQVGIFDTFLALVCKLLNRFLLLFVESYALLLILKKGYQVVVFFSASLKLRADRAQTILVLSCLALKMNNLRLGITLLKAKQVEFLGENIDFVLLLGC